MILTYLRNFCLVAITFVIIQSSCKTPNPTDVTSINCDHLIISPIADQVVVAGTRSYIPISVLAATLDDVKFTTSVGSNVLSLTNTQRGRAILTIDATQSNIGTHPTTIDVKYGAKSACISFKINIIDFDKTKNIIHFDPSQNIKGDGSEQAPYGSLAQQIAAGFTPKTGDVILLYTGNHGDVILSESNYMVASKNGHKARLKSLLLKDAHNISIRGLEIRPEQDFGNHDNYLVLIDSTCSEISLSNNQVISTHDATTWTTENWNNRASRGIKCRADQCVIENNLVQNIFHGIKTEGDHIMVQYNHVDRFGGDAIRNTGSNNTYKANFLTNATVDDYYAAGGNHDDLFQSWTFDKPIDNILLFDNIMVSCIDTLMPQRAKIVQGLVCFDGFTTNWIVVNNLVVTDHPHGISLYGAENCNILNNTVLKNPHDLYQYESNPWIMVNNHKDGRKSKNNVVNNNTCSTMNTVSEDVAQSNNTILDTTQIQKLYNYDQWDFRIKK